MEDPTVRRLTKKVFPHLWVRHKLMSSVPSGIFPFSEMTTFSQGIGNAVIVYLHIYRPTLSKYLEKHIPAMPKSKLKFWTHVAFLCLQARLTNDDAFDYFLTTCAITAEVALHCYMNGYDDVLSLASVFFCAFFENELYASFHRSGGWAGLLRYIENTFCKELCEIVNGHIKQIDSPSEHLPVLITIQYEQLAAARREKFMSLSSFKIGEIEREEKTNTLVSRIFHWHFMENHRISDAKRGILKRMENVRHWKSKSNTLMVVGRSNMSSEADKILDASNQISNDFQPLRSHNEAHPSEFATTMFKTLLSNKSIQILDDSECTEVRKESKTQLSSNKQTSEKEKINSSSSLLELRNFYESLSSASKRKTDSSKHFRNTNERRNRLDSPVEEELANRQEKMNIVKHQTTIVPNSSENGGTSPKTKHFTPEAAIKPTKPFNVVALSEFTKSLQELGFQCLCVGNSSHLDEKSADFANYAEVVEKCRHFQNKYPSIQFAILTPNNCYKSETSHAPQTENCDDIFSKNKNNEQLLSNTVKKYCNNSDVSPQIPHSEIEKMRSEATAADKNQFILANGHALLQNCKTENIRKSRFVVTKVKEDDLSSRSETSKRSRFSVTKVNDDQMILRDNSGLMGSKNADEPKTVSRFTVTKVNETQLKDGTSIFGGNCINSTKISRFTVTKVNENQLRDRANNWKNKTFKTSRFTVTKVDEDEFKNGARILRKNWTNGKTPTSRFTVTSVDENQARPFKNNGSIKYQKRVSFSEEVTYYTIHSSSDESITSRESINQNSPEEAQSARNSEHAAKQENTLNPPTPKNPLVTERRKYFQRLSSGERQSSTDNSESSNRSSASAFFDRIFRRSTSNSKVDESPTENKEETNKQKIEKLEMSLETAGIDDPVVFKI